MTAESHPSYRVTIRHRGGGRVGYEVLEIEAADLRAALTRTVERFPDHLAGSADLIEVRAANPEGEA